jgi:hypothetical protein
MLFEVLRLIYHSPITIRFVTERLNPRGRLNPGSWGHANARLAYARSSFSRRRGCGVCQDLRSIRCLLGLCASDLLQLREVMCQMTCQQMHNPLDGKGAVVGMHERRGQLRTR